MGGAMECSRRQRASDRRGSARAARRQPPSAVVVEVNDGNGESHRHLEASDTPASRQFLTLQPTKQAGARACSMPQSAGPKTQSANASLLLHQLFRGHFASHLTKRQRRR